MNIQKQNRDGVFISATPFLKEYHVQKNEHLSTVIFDGKLWQLEQILLVETKKKKQAQRILKTIKPDFIFQMPQREGIV